LSAFAIISAFTAYTVDDAQTVDWKHIAAERTHHVRIETRVNFKAN
jgi:hypothetical protein